MKYMTVNFYVFTEESCNVLITMLHRAGYRVKEDPCEEYTHIIYAKNDEDLALVKQFIEYFAY